MGPTRIKTTTLITVVILMAISVGASAYEDKPFKFNVVVGDSLVFVFMGIEFNEFILEYHKGTPELYLNGVPVFNSYPTTTENDCWGKYSENEIALRYLQSGLSCSQVEFQIKDDFKVLHGELSEWFDQPEQKGRSDLFLSLGLIDQCGQSKIASEIKGALVIGGQPYIYASTGWANDIRVRKVLLAEDNWRCGTMCDPFREMALSFSQQLVEWINGGSYSVIAIGRGGASVTMSGKEYLAKCRFQLDKIEAEGKYVLGPIPRDWFE